ncbi:hypothetical protein T492DRAFT_1152628, partial [Pavlovales sp. CCMP2436]
MSNLWRSGRAAAGRTHAPAGGACTRSALLSTARWLEKRATTLMPRTRSRRVTSPSAAFRATSWVASTALLRRATSRSTSARTTASGLPMRRAGLRPGALETHKRTHSGERPFACDEPRCKYRTTTVSNLTTHKCTHNGERPYACNDPGCEYRAAKAGSLTAHKRTHCGEWPYACDEPDCEYRAAETGSLTSHKRAHSGERPCACDEPGCKYRAAEAGSLTRHKRTHSGERPYACDEPGCEYRAAEAGSLKRHKRTHSVYIDHIKLFATKLYRQIIGHFSDSSRVRSYDRAARREHGDSVAYRRFPALKQFTDEELAAITMPYEHPTGMTPSSSMQF